VASEPAQQPTTDPTVDPIAKPTVKPTADKLPTPTPTCTLFREFNIEKQKRFLNMYFCTLLVVTIISDTTQQPTTD
jgi:hypothetical protein